MKSIESKHDLSNPQDTSIAPLHFRDLGAELRPTTLTRGEVYTQPIYGFPSREVYRSLAPSQASEPVWRSLDQNFSTFPSNDAFNPMNQKMPKMQMSSKEPFSHFQPIAHSQSFIEEVQPPAVPGGYLEPAYHFFSTSKPEHLFQSVLLSLQQSQVHCTPKPREFQVKCQAYLRCLPVNFFVNIFTSSSPSDPSPRYAVEFQRRSGCIMQFCCLYKRLKASILEGISTSITPAQPLPLDDVVCGDEVSRTMKCLLQMTSSEFADVKTQGLQAFVELSSDKETQNRMIKEGYCDPLFASLNCHHGDVPRCALALVANLAEQRKDVCRHFVKQGVIAKLLPFTSSGTTEVVREASRLIRNIGETLGKDVVDADFRQNVATLEHTMDPCARNHVAVCKQAVCL